MLSLPADRAWVLSADTKYMNANDNIDGAASWLMCSVGTAKRLGIPEEKWVYQHSGAHCHEGTEQVRSTPPRNALQPGRDHTRTCSLPERRPRSLTVVVVVPAVVRDGSPRHVSTPRHELRHPALLRCCSRRARGAAAPGPLQLLPMRRAGAITPRPLRPVGGAGSNTTASVCAVIVMAQAWALCLLAALPVPARFCDRSRLPDNSCCSAHHRCSDTDRGGRARDGPLRPAGLHRDRRPALLRSVRMQCRRVGEDGGAAQGG